MTLILNLYLTFHSELFKFILHPQKPDKFPELSKSLNKERKKYENPNFPYRVTSIFN